MLAGMATGVYKDRDDAAQKTIRLSKYFLPQQEVKEAYRASENMYHEIYRSLTTVRDQWPGIVK